MSNPALSLPFVLAQQLRTLGERASEVKVYIELDKLMVLFVGWIFCGLVLGDGLFVWLFKVLSLFTPSD